MGGSLKYLPDGADFGSSPDHFPTDFGFKPTEGMPSASRPNRTKPTREGGHKGPHHSGHNGAPKGDLYADGGHTMHHVHPHGHKAVHVENHDDGSFTVHHAHGGSTFHYADGGVTHHDRHGREIGGEGFREEHAMAEHEAPHSAVFAHPNGNKVVRVQGHHDGEIHHHAHGGYTHHHDDGRVTHHDENGHLIHHGAEMAKGGHHRSRAGDDDMAQDKALVSRAIRQHEDHEHDGEHTQLHLRRGGPTLRPNPGMKPEAFRTPRNVSPTGQMGYGVQPGDEDQPGGSGQDMPGAMAGGGGHGVVGIMLGMNDASLCRLGGARFRSAYLGDIENDNGIR